MAQDSVNENDHLFMHEEAPVYLTSGLHTIVELNVSPQLSVPLATHVDGPVLVYCTGSTRLLQVESN